MAQADENGFVKRGFLLLGAMAILAAVVLVILFYRPEPPPPAPVKDLPSAKSEPGWLIRYNATYALLRRGSEQTPWETVRELLDEKQQLKNCEAKRSDGSVVPDEYLARSFVISGLKALAEWPKKVADAGRKDEVPREIVAQVETLAKSPVPELKVQAEKTRLAIVR